MGRLQAFGVGDGAWKLPASSLCSESICYSAGAGEDLTFDLAVARQIGCQVHIFDPTPRAISHFATLRDNTSGGQKTAVGGSAQCYESDPQTIDRLHFHPEGLYGSEQTLRFYAPKDPSHVSHSIRNLQSTDSYFDAACKTVKSFMTDLGHDHLDLLKLDIEGAEHSVIDHLIEEGLKPRILCIEFDAALQQGRYSEAFMDLTRLVKLGYELAAIDAWNATLVARAKGHSPRFATRLRMMKLGWKVNRKNRQATRKAA